MVQRCTNPKSPAYHRYGGRGIEICARWRHFKHFLEDMGPRPIGTSLDREDNDKGYEPGNCRWATQRAQMRNTSRNKHIEIDGVVKTLAEWCDIYGVDAQTVTNRVQRRGVSWAQAFTARPHKGSRRYDYGH